MRVLVLIAFLMTGLLIPGQVSFYDVYSEAIKEHTAYLQEQKDIDSLKNKSFMQKELLQNNSTIRHLETQNKLSGKLLNVYFPDINFSDLEHKSYMISDFEGEVIVNYNRAPDYKFISQMDSTRKRINNKNIKVITLFTENYRKEAARLKDFGENVVIGFVTFDTRDLIALRQGFNTIYFLDKDHRIDFFGRAEDRSWTRFLDQRLN